MVIDSSSISSNYFSFNLNLSDSISDLKSLMIFLYSAICIATNFLFGNYFVFIFFALFAYFNVFIVSSNYDDAGDIFAIITVLQLPPNESFSNLVNLLSL